MIGDHYIIGYVCSAAAQPEGSGVTNVEAFVAAVIFGCVFLFGHHLRIRSARWSRAGLSLAAGVSVAYVFIHLLPGLSEAAEALAEVTARPVWRTQFYVHMAALGGFVVFYGLDNMVGWSRGSKSDDTSGAGTAALAFGLHVGGFAVYVALISYLLIRGPNLAQTSLVLYATAMGLHFLGIDHDLLRQHAARYLRRGRLILAAAAMVGWACGAWMEIPTRAVVLLAALVAGGVIINSTILELPPGKEGRFLPFLLGAGGYAALIFLATRIGAAKGGQP